MRTWVIKCSLHCTLFCCICTINCTLHMESLYSYQHQLIESLSFFSAGIFSGKLNGKNDWWDFAVQEVLPLHIFYSTTNLYPELLSFPTKYTPGGRKEQSNRISCCPVSRRSPLSILYNSFHVMSLQKQDWPDVWSFSAIFIPWIIFKGTPEYLRIQKKDVSFADFV